MMATDTMTSPSGIASHTTSILDHGIIIDSNTANVIHEEEVQRSSSLSEIGERAGHDGAENASVNGLDAIDTEAETERLEDSPQKRRTQQNVLLTSTETTYQPHESPLETSALPIPQALGDPRSVGVEVEATSDISSLIDSGEETGKELSTSPPSPRKRKRSNSERNSLSDQEIAPLPSAKAAKLFSSTVTGALMDDHSLEESTEEDDQEVVANESASSPTTFNLKPSPEPILPKRKYQKGRRKGRKSTDDELDIVGNDDIGTGSPARHDENQGANFNNQDEGAVGDLPDGESALKSEEGLIQKKGALNFLNTLEKCFASLRDHLFNERLAQCNEELAMLEAVVPTHPELLAMKDVIDQRRDQKIHYEKTLTKYNLQTLQRESIANKAQAHSQYMQTVRDTRDSYLEQLNEDFYQLQRERRNADGDVPDYHFTFPMKRSEQIKHQTAYNTEVSLLSGIAKHVGFPAAPEISKGKAKEIEDDLRSMGISTQIPQALPNPPPILRAASSFSSRQRSRADEQFLEQTPWANPQHPSHHNPRQQMHRQVSALSRAATPSSSPAAQKRVVDLTEPHGSASTIPENPSRPNSSAAVTPATGVASQTGPLVPAPISNRMIESTPSKSTGGPSEATPVDLTLSEARMDGGGKVPQPMKSEKSQSPSIPKNRSQEIKTPSSLPKPLPFVHSGGGAPSSSSSAAYVPRTSTPGRYNAIKSEDPSHMARHSPMPRYHTPPISTVGNGQMNRFAT